jgi:hypothetical protein
MNVRIKRPSRESRNYVSFISSSFRKSASGLIRMPLSVQIKITVEKSDSSGSIGILSMGKALFGKIKRSEPRCLKTLTTDGMTIGPIIPNEDLHVTAYEKNGIFNSHFTYFDKIKRKPTYEKIITLSQEDMIRNLVDLREEWISVTLEKYDENDEALVLTDEGQKVFRQLLKGSICINVLGRKVFFEMKFGNLVEKLSVLEDRIEDLIRVGKVQEALSKNFVPNLMAPDLRPILQLDNQMYVFQASSFGHFGEFRFFR